VLTAVIIGVAFVLATIWFVTEGGFEPLITSLIILATIISLLLANRKKISVGRRSLKLNSKDPLAKNWQHLRYSFAREEFVNPLIVSELLGNLADSGHPVTSIDLIEANRSNRFSCEIECDENDGSTVISTINGDERFSYYHVGTSKSGIHIVHTSDCNGGSGAFHYIVMLTLSSRNGVVFTEGQLREKERVVLSVLGCIPIGDRYCGDIRYDGKNLLVGADSSPLPEHILNKKLKIRIR